MAKRTTKPRRAIPAWPEILHKQASGEARTYDVREWNPGLGFAPRTSRQSGQMWVPRGDTAYDRMIRFHEQTHTLISPACPEDGLKDIPEANRPDPQSILAMEDARIQNYAVRRKIDAAYRALPGEPPPRLLKEAEEGNILAAVRTACATYGTPFHDPSMAVLWDMGLDVRRIASILSMLPYESKFSHTIEAARLLDKFLAGMNPGGPTQAIENDQENEANDDTVRWGAMDIECPPLTQRMRSPKAARVGWKPTTQGDVLVFPQLLATGAIFGRRKVKRGIPQATVLVDVSGSMHFNEGDVAEIVQVVPAAMVAAYCGRLDHGKLWIVAKKGRQVRELPAFEDRCNIVDGPALAWLGRQKGPRVWLSDGRVAGASDERAGGTFSRAHTLDAVRLCQAGQITRCDNLTQVLNLLRYGARFHYVPPMADGERVA